METEDQYRQGVEDGKRYGMALFLTRLSVYGNKNALEFCEECPNSGAWEYVIGCLHRMDPGLGEIADKIILQK